MDNVPDFHLGPGGRELSPHATAAFGFAADFDLLDELRGILVRNGPLSVTLTELTAFTSGAHAATGTGSHSARAEARRCSVSSGQNR